MKDAKVQAKYFKEFKTKKIYSPTILGKSYKNFNLIIKGDIKILEILMLVLLDLHHTFQS